MVFQDPATTAPERAAQPIASPVLQQRGCRRPLSAHLLPVLSWVPRSVSDISHRYRSIPVLLPTRRTFRSDSSCDKGPTGALQSLGLGAQTSSFSGEPKCIPIYAGGCSAPSSPEAY